MEQDWKMLYYPQASVLPGQYSKSQATQLRSMRLLGFQAPEDDSSTPEDLSGLFDHWTNTARPDHMQQAHLTSDVDMAAPYITCYSENASGSFTGNQPLDYGLLGVPGMSPEGDGRSTSARTSLSSFDFTDVSYNAFCVQQESNRPQAARATTAPEANTIKLEDNKSQQDQSIAMDESFAHNEETKGGRGRKRQRIPHTAVERRYRENLNAHVDRLRQAVPTLTSRPHSGGGRSGQAAIEGIKPSKCEILNGAIEHIAALTRENQRLEADNEKLRARMEDLTNWCSLNLRSGPPFGV